MVRFPCFNATTHVQWLSSQAQVPVKSVDRCHTSVNMLQPLFVKALYEGRKASP